MNPRAALLTAVIACTTTAAAAQAPQPAVANGKVEVRNGAAVDREIAAVSSPNSTEPVWLAWRAPMVPGDRDLCSSWYETGVGGFRGVMLSEDSLQRPQPAARPAGPTQLEAGTSILILVRAIGGQVERIRTIGDDCPLDAGGRTVYWLPNVTPAESLRYLTGLTRQQQTDRTLLTGERTIASSAVHAIGYHRDASADGTLDQIATSHPDPEIRRQAASAMASLRGAAGLAAVTRLLAAEKDPARRRSLVNALGRSPEAGAVARLRELARDADAGVRADAASLFVTRGGTPVIPDALQMLEKESDDNVKKRIVSAIGRLPGDAGIPHLIQLARATSTTPFVRKEAVGAVSQSKDPRAIAFLEEILKK